MSNLLSEEKVLKKLNIENFTSLTKGKAIDLASMIDKMEPEVAKKALEQFPEFAVTAKEMLVEYKDSLDKCVESNNESVKSCYEAYNSIIVSLQKELDKEEISFEERKYIIEQMKEVADKISNKDSENKKWLAGMATIGAAALVGVATVLSTVLGGNAHVQSIDTDNKPK